MSNIKLSNSVKWDKSCLDVMQGLTGVNYSEVLGTYTASFEYTATKDCWAFFRYYNPHYISYDGNRFWYGGSATLNGVIVPVAKGHKIGQSQGDISCKIYACL